MKRTGLLMVGMLTLAFLTGCTSRSLNRTANQIALNAPADKTDPHTPGEEAIFGGMEFVWIPSGTFTMGSPLSEQDRYSDEGPRHRVTFTQGFWMGKYPVTQAQWTAAMGSNPSHFTDDASLPVEQVSWNDITRTGGFLDRLNHANPRTTFRLPTEAEWEYAGRAGTTTRFYWGDDPSYRQIDCFAWYTGNSGSAAHFVGQETLGQKTPGMWGLYWTQPVEQKTPNTWGLYETHPVGRKMPNGWGLYDMSGNVREWCQDWYGSYEANAVSDPHAASASGLRVLRGGSWDDGAKNCRSADRYGDDPDGRNSYDGVRLCVSL